MEILAICLAPLAVLLILALAWNRAKIAQLNWFTPYMQGEILRIGNIKYSEIISNVPVSCTYPDVEKSYDRLDKAMPLNRNFESIVVYHSKDDRWA